MGSAGGTCDDPNLLRAYEQIATLEACATAIKKLRVGIHSDFYGDDELYIRGHYVDQMSVIDSTAAVGGCFLEDFGVMKFNQNLQSTETSGIQRPICQCKGCMYFLVTNIFSDVY